MQKCHEHLCTVLQTLSDLIHWICLSRSLYNHKGFDQGLLHCRQNLYQLSYQGSPENILWLSKLWCWKVLSEIAKVNFQLEMSENICKMHKKSILPFQGRGGEHLYWILFYEGLRRNTHLNLIFLPRVFKPAQFGWWEMSLVMYDPYTECLHYCENENCNEILLHIHQMD